MAQIQMEVYAKLNSLRVYVVDANPKKTGVNNFQGFSYFTLEDFLPLVIKKANELGLSWSENFFTKKIDSEPPVLLEVGELTIVHTASGSSVTFTVPIDYSPVGKMNQMQVIGSSITYARRYLWQNALGLTDHDMYDRADQNNWDNLGEESNKVTKSIDKIQKNHDATFKRGSK